VNTKASSRIRRYRLRLEKIVIRNAKVTKCGRAG
jgi:hypothetical protein